MSVGNGKNGMDDGAGSGDGFGHPVFDSQAVFSAIMRALSRPGTVVDLGRRLRAPSALQPGTAAILAALADYETPVWLDEALRRDDDTRRWIGFQTGAVLVAEPGRARFAVGSAASDLPDLSAFSLGTPDHPDRSTTLILTVDALEGGPVLSLTGPGIETVATIAPQGLTAIFHADWAINAALFPRGIDVILVAGERAIGLPRTTRIGSA